MTMPSPDGAGTHLGAQPPSGAGRSEAVEQARAWLAQQSGHVGSGPALEPGPVLGTEPASEPGAALDTGAATEPGSPPELGPRGGSAPAVGDEGPRSPSQARRRGRGAARPSVRGDGRGESPQDDPDAEPQNVARTIALRKLTAQARTRHELDQALQKKNVPDEVATSVLDRLEQVGLLDDATFAQDWVASRQQRRHLSRSALRRELQGKGVDRDHVDAALAMVDTDDELAAARALAVKKAATMRGLEPVVRRRRLAGALARRGFGSGIVSTVLGELRDDEGADPGA